MNPDEDVVLNIGADTTDVERKLSALQSTVKHAFESGNASVRKYGIQLDKIVEKMERQRNIMRQLASQQFENPEYTKIAKEVTNLEKAWNKVNNELDKMFEKGAYGEEAYETMALQAEKLYEELQKALAVKEQMEKEGTNVIAGKDTEQYARAAREFNREWKNAGIVIQTMNEAKAAVDKTTDSVNKTNNALDRTEKEAREAGTEIRNFGKQGNSAIRNLATRIKDGIIRRLREGKKETANFGNESEFSFKKALKFVIRYGIGMASLFRVYRRLRVLTKETLQNMGKVIPEVGQQLVDLSNHVLQLKNSLATVAQPLLNQFLPAIHAVISALVSAMNALANFFAMLTGQKFIYKAAKGNKKLADSISGAGKAAKEAKEEIAEYDKLIVLDQPNDGSGGGGGGGAADDAIGTWEKVDGYMTHFIQDIQRIWSVFQQAWEMYGQPVMDAFNFAWTTMKRLATDVWHTFVNVFTNGTGLRWVKSVLDIFTTVLTTIGLLGTAFDDAWNKNGRGYRFVTSVLSLWTQINKLVKAIGDSFNEAIKTGIGEDIFANLLEILSGINETITKIVSKFTEAWSGDGASASDEGSRGTTIFSIILGTINDILTKINECVAATKIWADKIDFSKALDSIISLLGSVKLLTNQISDACAYIYQNIILPLMQYMINEGIPKGIQNVADLVAKIATSITAIKEIISPLTDLITALNKSSNKNSVLNNFLDLTSKLGTNNFINSTVIGKFVDFLSTVQKLRDILKDIRKLLYGESVDEDVANQLGAGAGTGLGHGVGRKFTTREEKDSYDLGKAIIEGLVLGMEDAMDAHPIMFGGFANKFIIEPIKKALGIHSPSKVMKQIGKDIIAGLLAGINADWEDFFSTWSGMCDSIFEKLGGLLENGQQALSNAWNAAKQKLAPVAPYIKNQFSIAYGGVTGVWGGLGAYFSNKSESVKSAFNGLDGALGGIFSATYHAMTKPFSNTANDFDSYGQQAKLGLGFGADKTKGINAYAGKVYGDAYKQMTDPFKNIKSDFDEYGRSAKLGLGFGGNTTGVNTYAGKVYGDAYTQMIGAFSGTAKAFEGIGASVQTGFSKGAQGAQTAMENLAKYVQGDFKTGMNSGFETSFNTFGSRVTDSFESSIRTLIDAFNKSIRTMADKLNSTIAKLNSALGEASGKSKGGSTIPPLNTNSVLIPKFLAQGAVLPPNKEFLAVLGDQHTGTNIETPLDTMIEAFRTALNEDGSSNHAPIVLQLNGKQVAQAVWDEELKRYKQTGSWNPRLA